MPALLSKSTSKSRLMSAIDKTDAFLYSEYNYEFAFLFIQSIHMYRLDCLKQLMCLFEMYGYLNNC